MGAPMADEPYTESVRVRAAEMSQHTAVCLLDSLFLAFWALINFGFYWIVAHIKVTEVAHVIVICLEVLFGVATIAPICIWLYKDLSIMVIRANRKIAGEKTAGGTSPKHLQGERD